MVLPGMIPMKARPMQVQTFIDNASFITASAAVMLDACQEAATHIPTYFALSGGDTPKEVYSYFATTLLKQKDCRIHGYMVDERYVPDNHTGSNWQMIYTHLIKPAEQTAPNRITEWSPFQTNIEIHKAVAQYEKDIQELFAMRQQFDLVVLGIGADGHTASLFPHTPAVTEKDAYVAHVSVPGTPYPHRLTLTFPAIMSAKKILLLAKGKEKKDILENLIKKDTSITEFPAKKLLEHPHLLIHYKT